MFNIIGFQCLGLQGNPLVIGIEVQGPQDCTIAGFPTDSCQGLDEIGFRHFAQMVFAKTGRYGFHLCWDRGVFVGEVTMVGAAVDDAQRQSRMGEIKRHRFNNGLGRITKIDRNNPANRRGHLVHQATGLAVVDIFCILADLGDGHWVDLAVGKQRIDDVTNQDFESGGRRKS